MLVVTEDPTEQERPTIQQATDFSIANLLSKMGKNKAFG